MIFLIIHQFASKYLKNHIFGILDEFSTLYTNLDQNDVKNHVFGRLHDFSTLYNVFGLSVHFST